jgi:hypothetical protein
MTTRPDPAGRWRKSTYSGSGNNCVEVRTTGAGIAVRDSRNPHGAVLTLTASQWRTLTRTIRADSDQARPR